MESALKYDLKSIRLDSYIFFKGNILPEFSSGPPPSGGVDENSGRPWNLTHSPLCRTSCRLFIHEMLFGPLGLHLRVRSELGRSPPFRPMRALRYQWSRAFSLCVWSGPPLHILPSVFVNLYIFILIGYLLIIPTHPPTRRRHRAASYPIGYNLPSSYPDTERVCHSPVLDPSLTTGIDRACYCPPSLLPFRRGRIGGLANDLLLCIAFGSHSPSPISPALISRFLRRLLLSPLAAPIPSSSPCGGCCPDFTHQTTLPQRLLSIPTFLIYWIHWTHLTSSLLSPSPPRRAQERKGKWKMCEYPGVPGRT